MADDGLPRPDMSDVARQDRPGTPVASRSRRHHAILIALFALVGSAIFFITAYALTQVVGPVERSVSVVFAFLVLVALALGVTVIAQLADVFGPKGGLGGARMHRRMVLLFLAVGTIPALLAFVLTALVLKSFSDEYFVERVREANQVAKDLANSYFDAESRKAGLEMVQLRTDLALQARNGLSPETQPIGFRRYLLGQTILRGFSAIVLLDENGQIIAEANRRPEGRYGLPPQADFAELSAPGATPFKFSVHDQATFDAWYAVLKVGAPSYEYLVVYRAENPGLSGQLLEVREFRDETADVRDRLRNLERTFSIGYGLVVTLFLLASIWVGLVVANALVGPIRRLATAAGAVSAGDLTSRVDVRPRDGELGDLGHAFNNMTERLDAQRRDILTAHEQSDARRRFIEAVVSSVPAGVINIDQNGKIALANPSAAAILGQSEDDLPGAAFDDIAPELRPLLATAMANEGQFVLEQVELPRKGITRIINVQISPNDRESRSGYLVTLDDITELISAQRNAAWREVARRIAHEIKNPLTPIQLSAERLRRRYGKKFEEDREVFDLCTDTIIRHVGDIGRMVNEFSSFARMPEPIIATEDLREVVKSAAFSFGVANQQITFSYDMPSEKVEVDCDGRLIGQAVVNLVKNAVEAITEGAERPDGEIIVRVRSDGPTARIDVVDNGKGLPELDRSRLTEPYMTTREKGTGLGLAIVRKAVEEHGGTFALIDRKGEGMRGAIARIILPTRSARRTGGSSLSSLPQKEDA